jgi:L-arabinose isomerase
MIKYAVFPLKVLPVLVCRKEIMSKEEFKERIKELERNLSIQVQILEEVVINEESALALLEKPTKEADVILLYKPYFDLGECVIKIAEYNLPIILFKEPYKINGALDALENIWDKKDVWVAIDYLDINSRLELLQAKKRIENTKLLVLNADYPNWKKWQSRIFGGIEAIKSKFGMKIEYVKSEEVINRWRDIKEERVKGVVEEWIKNAKKIIEPTEKDVAAVARLYLVIKDLLEEKNAQAITMAEGEGPLPVPCFAYVNLRDEGIPAGCEADILSLLLMVILHHLTDRPSYMGGIGIEPDDNDNLIISHCVVPRKMAGYKTAPVSYVLRDYHGEKFIGSLTAYLEMKIGERVTVCRLSGNLKTMFLTTGVITGQKDIPNDCRNIVKVKIGNAREFIHRTSGCHHVMVYGDYKEKIRELNELFGITTT